MKLKPSLLAAGLMAAATPAVAHTGTHSVEGLSAGFLHPFSGIDHILAMAAVGVLAALLGGRATWAVPASFVVMMLVGSALGLIGIPVPGVEMGIAASVVVLGIVVALGRPWPVPVVMGLVGMFAVFHGYAHGTEIPNGAGAVLFSLGFVLASAILHMVGIAAGLLTLGFRQPARIAGAAVTAAGLLIALS